MRWVGVVLVVAAGVARADVYPETYVDRPQLLYRWMAEVDISLDLAHYTDAAGTKHVDTKPDEYSAFSLGEAELALHIVGSHATLSASLQLDGYGVVTSSFEYYAPQTTYRYAFAEALGYAYKAHVVPHLLALYFSGSARLLEESLTPDMMPASAGSTLGINLGTSAQLQLTRRLAFDSGIDLGFPIAHSSSLLISPSAGASAYVELTQTFHRCDFYANAYLGLTGIRDVAGSFGFVHRWGGS